MPSNERFSDDGYSFVVERVGKSSAAIAAIAVGLAFGTVIAVKGAQRLREKRSQQYHPTEEDEKKNTV